MERTFAMVKPNAVKKNRIGKIVAMMEEEGLKVIAMKLVHMSKEKAEAFYGEHKERPFFGSLVSFMTSGPTVLLALESEGAVDKYRKLMGATDPAKAAPNTIRKLYAESIEANSVHGSDSPESAKREIAFWFEGELR